MPLTLHCLFRLHGRRGNPWLLSLINNRRHRLVCDVAANGRRHVARCIGRSASKRHRDPRRAVPANVWPRQRRLHQQQQPRRVSQWREQGHQRGGLRYAVEPRPAHRRLPTTTTSAPSNMLRAATSRKRRLWNAALDDAEVAALGKFVSPLLIRPSRARRLLAAVGRVAPDGPVAPNRNDFFPLNSADGGRSPAVYMPWHTPVPAVDAPIGRQRLGAAAWPTAEPAGEGRMNLGDFRLGDTFDVKFTTVNTTGLPTTLVGGVVVAYPGNSVAEIVAGITLTLDFDGRVGLHNVRVVASARERVCDRDQLRARDQRRHRRRHVGRRLRGRATSRLRTARRSCRPCPLARSMSAPVKRCSIGRTSARRRRRRTVANHIESISQRGRQRERAGVVVARRTSEGST